MQIGWVDCVRITNISIVVDDQRKINKEKHVLMKGLQMCTTIHITSVI